MNKLSIKAFLVILFLGWTVTSLAETKWLDKIIAKVDDDVILDSELNRRLETAKKQILANNGSLPPEDALKKQVLERLIMDQIQLQLAARAGIRISDEELNAALEQVAQSSQTTIEAMKQELESDGMNFTLFREDIRSEMMISRVRQGSVNQKVYVSEQEIDDILVLMEEQGASNTQYHLRHLMVRIPESAGPDDVDAARAKVQSIIERFNNGEDFTQLVITESDGSDALTGGDLGLRNAQTLPTLFLAPARNLEIGQLSDPIRSPNGLHLLKLENRQGGIEKQMVDEVNYRHIMIKVSTVMSDAKAEAKLLTIRKDILDGNASFDEQAKVHSEDLSSASSGGDLGWAAPQAFEQIYGTNVRELKDGEISQPFRGGEGWLLVEKLGTRKTDQTEEVKRLRARRILHNRKFDEEQESWLREIRESAYVDILETDDS